MPEGTIVDIVDKLEGRIPINSPADWHGRIPPGQYYFKYAVNDELTSAGQTPVRKIWFTTPHFDSDTIERLDSIQLLTDSHDQGFVDDLSAGNWTWFELAIVGADGKVRSAANTDMTLSWTSHSNRFNTNTYGWKEGAVFGGTHDMMDMLQDGDAFSVQLCAQFNGWSIKARKGFLLIDLGMDEVVRSPPPAYDDAIERVKSMESIFVKANSHLLPAFTLRLPSTMLTSAERLGNSKGSPLRVLSLDGGGVRGISSLLLLKAVMDRIAPGKLPCDVFDLIGGTSTGGYIAIMLGRLRMSVDECLDTYRDFMPQIFDKGTLEKSAHFLLYNYIYSDKQLEELIKGLVKARLGNENAPLLDPADPNPRCKVFCMAVYEQAVNNRAPVFLRSYTNPQERSQLPGITIWQAARATSAAPAYFKPIEVNGLKLVDGGLSANNPVGWLWTEVLSVFGAVRPTKCFLSVGTGIPPNANLVPFGILGHHSVERTWVSVACNTEIVDMLFRSLIDAFAPMPMSRKYFRLNVGEVVVPPTDPNALPSYKPIGDLDSIDTVAGLEKMTVDYIDKSTELLDDIARVLHET